VKKWLWRAPLLLIAVLLVVLLSGYLYLRGSLPQLDGKLLVPGLSDAVEIVRDADAVPHIFAKSARDAYFALGFVHAQDRLWQLEMNRRIGSGRLAEAFGPTALDNDKFLRTLGIRRSAEAIYRKLDAATQDRLRAYAAGINAFLNARSGALPAEFLITGVAPEPWTPVDSVCWQMMMAWDLGGNWSQELLRLRLSKKLNNAQIEQFLPPYPGDAPVHLPDLRRLYAGLDIDATRLALAAPPSLPEGAGSNNWVVAGSRSESGKPLLANDPHLGLATPAIWYFAHLDAPELHVIGATLPGVPAVVLGRNQRIAWGFTNTAPDVQYLYIEKIDPADRANYLAPDGPRRFAVIEERIKVKGAPDTILQVRISRHGPIISDVIKGGAELLPRDYGLAFQWTALAPDDRTIVAGDKLARAGNWHDFLDAARDFHAPEQNVVYADVDGNIGFIAPGRIPIRKPENDLHGLAPAPGWDARYDWDGFIPFEKLPQQFNPASAKIVTANQKVVPDAYPYWITSEWSPPYRAQRIDALLDAVAKHSVQSFRNIQGDIESQVAKDLLPFILKIAPSTEQDRQALALLKDWNGDMRAAAPQPLLLHAWLREFTRLIYQDELGDLFAGAWDQRSVFTFTVLRSINGAERWCDDVSTPAVETCAMQVARALSLAVSDLQRHYGNDMSKWRWGEAHLARSAHRPFSGKPVVGELFDITVPSPGDTYTVNVGRNNIKEPEPFTNRHAASLRAIYDLADLDRSLFIHSTGQSGNRLSPYYANFVTHWAHMEYLPMTMKRAEIERGAIGTLRLSPR
jgi:penicillin G amidase